MADLFRPLTASALARWVFGELAEHGRVFGIPQREFWVAKQSPFAKTLFGRTIDTPLGVAAGPHTQLAQNIVSAWLCGARFIELKTVQTLDTLDVSKPCIDAADETYNCEWSQELTLDQSFGEYLNAWVLLHALEDRFGLRTADAPPRFLFNLSVGYNMQGILAPNVQRFLARVRDARAELPGVIEAVAAHYPRVRELAIGPRLSDNITLSTMHGCPPAEIERIGLYLIEEQGLHTTIKLNPTLLGPERLRALLNDALGFRRVQVPDEAFAHDPKYPDAVAMIRRLQAAAAARGVQFGLKLSNTLEVLNHRPIFPAHEKQMYLSGRALHPLTVQLAALLHTEFAGTIPISFAGGADAFNLPELLAAGFAPVTVCTDLLKPGGYLRLPQYLETLGAAMAAGAAPDLDAFVLQRAAASGPNAAAGDDPATVLRQAVGTGLRRYAAACPVDRRYRARLKPADLKGPEPLDWFDCMDAPCRAGCPASQDIPGYLRLVAAGAFSEALALIRETNPLPLTTGCVCDHPCTTRCVRNHYDESLHIRAIKRVAATYGAGAAATPAPAAPHGTPVAVVGAGPAGLSAAAALATAGYAVTLFEAAAAPGGMAAAAVPLFRLPNGELARDLDALSAAGVTLRFGTRVGHDVPFPLPGTDEFRHVVVAVGAPAAQRLDVPGEDAAGVFSALDFLQRVRAGTAPPLGRRVLVVGGGNAAMDAARTAWRLSHDTEVAVLYRRSVAEMPADVAELEALRDEGITLVERVAPLAVLHADGRVIGLRCENVQLGEVDKSGRPRPVRIAGSEHDRPADTIIVAVGQAADAAFLDAAGAKFDRRGRVLVDPVTLESTAPGIYAGGDVRRGPATVIAAVADGLRIARSILEKDGRAAQAPARPVAVVPDVDAALAARGRRVRATAPPERPAETRRDLEPVEDVYGLAEARAEAARCLSCDQFCGLCVTVCPNRANIVYPVAPRTWRLPRLQREGARIVVTGFDPFCVEQPYQIVHFAQFCNACGNCTTFCPTAGAPYRDKPRLHVDRAAYEADLLPQACFVARDGAAWLIETRAEGVRYRLVQRGADLYYETPALRLTVPGGDFARATAEPGPDPAPPPAALRLEPAARLAVLLEGVRAALPFALP